MTTVPNSSSDDDPAAPIERPYQDHFAQVYHRVIDDERIGKLGIAAYVALARFADFNTGECEVRRTKLAKVARLSVRGLDNGLDELVAAGYLRIQRIQKIDGSWAPSKYYLLDTAVAQMAVSQGGSAHHALGGTAHGAPPPSAQDARGVSHTVHEGGAHGATQEQETVNKRHKNENAELPLDGGDVEPARPMSLNRRAQAITRRYVDRVPLTKFPAILGMVKRALEVRATDGLSPRYFDDEVDAALQRLADEGRPVTLDTLRIELDGITPTRRAAGTDRSPSDQRVQTVQDRAAQMRAREAAGR